MSNLSIKAKFIQIRSEFSPIGAVAYVPLGTPIDQPLRILKISNVTDDDIVLSTDGTTDMDLIAANGFALYDLGTNRAEMGSTLQFAAGTQFYIKAANAPTTTGYVILTGIYAGV